MYTGEQLLEKATEFDLGNWAVDKSGRNPRIYLKRGNGFWFLQANFHDKDSDVLEYDSVRRSWTKFGGASYRTYRQALDDFQKWTIYQGYRSDARMVND